MGRSTLLNNKDYPQDTATGLADRNGFSVYLNFGFMYNLNSKWGIGLHQKISHSNFHHSVGLPILGLRGRLSYHLKDIELNISPGFGFAGRGIDIESTISWKDHIGIFTRYETYPAPYSKNLDLAKVYSVGIFTKGKKGFIVSTITTIVASVIFGSLYIG